MSYQDEQTATVQTNDTDTYPIINDDQNERKEISQRLRWATNGIHLVSILLFGGIIFGWAPLKLVLLGEGQFSDRCRGDDLGDLGSDDNGTVAFMRGDEVCAEQMRSFNAIFTTAQFLLNFVSLPVGFLIDGVSKVYYFTMAGSLMVNGLVLFGVSQSDSKDYFSVAYSLMALGGCMTIIGAYPASFLLRSNQPLLLAAGSCLFDASSVVFYLIYNFNASFPAIVSRKAAFVGLAGIAFVVYAALVVCWILLEKNDWRTVCDRENCIQNTTHDQESQPNPPTKDPHQTTTIPTTPQTPTHQPKSTSTSTSILHSRRINSLGIHSLTISQQILSYDFFLIATFASIHVLRCNLYIETVVEYLSSLGDDTNGTYAKIFGYVLPSGVLFVPLIDYSVARVGVVETLGITNVLGVVFGVVLVVGDLRLQVVNFGIFTCFRAFLYSTLGTFVAETFGVATMGRIIGLMYTIAAVVTLLQYPAASYAEGRNGNDFTSLNTAVLALCLLPIGIVMRYSYTLLRREEGNDIGDGDGDGDGTRNERSPLIDKR